MGSVAARRQCDVSHSNCGNTIFFWGGGVPASCGCLPIYINGCEPCAHPRTLTRPQEGVSRSSRTNRVLTIKGKIPLGFAGLFT